MLRKIFLLLLCVGLIVAFVAPVETSANSLSPVDVFVKDQDITYVTLEWSRDTNVDDDFNLVNIQYQHEHFIYPFDTLIIPTCIGVVPIVHILDNVPDKDQLDELYTQYTTAVNRDVEGFVINHNNSIEKYVRMKNGKLSDHFDRGE